MLTETPEIIVGHCAWCGNEILNGTEYVAFTGDRHNLFCDTECLNKQQLKDGNIEWCVAGDDTAVIARRW